MDPALLAGVDDDDKDNNKDISLAGVHDKDISFTGVPVCNTYIVTNADDDLDAESNRNSIDPNKADNNSSKAFIHSNGSYISIHSATSEPPQHPPDEEDKIEELPEPETEVPQLH